jgi:hypothetical protein
MTLFQYLRSPTVGRSLSSWWVLVPLPAVRVYVVYGEALLFAMVLAQSSTAGQSPSTIYISPTVRLATGKNRAAIAEGLALP